jgi:hypothetical protein
MLEQSRRHRVGFSTHVGIAYELLNHRTINSFYQHPPDVIFPTLIGQHSGKSASMSI